MEASSVPPVLNGTDNQLLVYLHYSSTFNASFWTMEGYTIHQIINKYCL